MTWTSKTNGIEFEVRDTQNRFLGDCFLTKTGLCEGKTTKANGKSIGWTEFIALMNKR